MKENYKKPIKDFKIPRDFNIVDETGDIFNRLVAFEKKINGLIQEYKTMLKTHNVYQMPPEIKDLQRELKRGLKEDVGNYNRIKWYHRNKTKYRKYFKRRIDNAKKALKYIETELAKSKKKFADHLKRDPNYFKKRYKLAIEKLKYRLKRIEQLKARVMRSSKVEEKVIVHLYKKLLDELETIRKGKR